MPTLRWLDADQGPAIALLDQTRLPAEETVVTCASVPELVDAIRRLVIRGAPVLGLAGAFGVALAAYRGEDVAAAARALGRGPADRGEPGLGYRPCAGCLPGGPAGRSAPDIRTPVRGGRPGRGPGHRG